MPVPSIVPRSVSTFAEDPVRRADELLHRVAVREHDVPVFRVLVRRRPHEVPDVALDVGERQVPGVLDVADLAPALLVGYGVGADDLRPEPGLLEPALEDRRVRRRLYHRDRVEVDVPLVRLDHRIDVNALDLPVEACVEPVRPVPHRDRQLVRVRVHADDEPRLVVDAARTQLHFSTHCAILSCAATYWSRRFCKVANKYSGSFAPGRWFRRRPNRPSSVGRGSRRDLTHWPLGRLPCVTASGYQSPAVPYHTPIRGSLSTPNITALSRRRAI